MNLINDRWIPVRRADGSLDKIAPWEITRDIHDDQKRIIAMASPRPDFDGALIQFLIGLLQTACAPGNDDVGWWEWLENPPIPDILKDCFDPYVKAFCLFDIDAPEKQEAGTKLFMQERLSVSEKAKSHPVSYLLIEASTDHAIKTNTDHFQKRPNTKDSMCKTCVAAALYTLQNFAPSGGGGGDGKNTSLRGGGPLSTIILGNNLWETVWQNVIIGGEFERRQCDEKTFPWLNIESYISEKNSIKTIHSGKMNPEHVFWGMPRRIQLEFFTSDNLETCSICGIQEKDVCNSFLDLTGGLTYQDKKGSSKRPSWISPLHPLSPYTIGEKNIPTAVHQHGRIGYRYWIGFIENIISGNTQRVPAKVVEQFRTIVRKDAQLWAYGYDMDNAKARCWYDAKMPILYIDTNLAPVFLGHASNMIKASRHISGLLVSAIIKAQMVEPEVKRNSSGFIEVEWHWPKDLLTRLKKSPSEKTNAIKEKIKQSVEDLESRVQNNMISFLNSARQDFWSNTEDNFYWHLKKLRELIETGTNEYTVMGDWLTVLKQKAIDIFSLYTDADFAAVNPKRISISHNEFLRTLNSRHLKNILGLPHNSN